MNSPLHPTRESRLMSRENINERFFEAQNRVRIENQNTHETYEKLKQWLKPPDLRPKTQSSAVKSDLSAFFKSNMRMMRALKRHFKSSQTNSSHLTQARAEFKRLKTHPLCSSRLSKAQVAFFSTTPPKTQAHPLDDQTQLILPAL